MTYKTAEKASSGKDILSRISFASPFFAFRTVQFIAFVREKNVDLAIL